jgi:hypothetical protein
MSVIAEIAQKIKNDQAEYLVESDIQTQIMSSDLTEKEKENFIKLISYFTPQEIEDLKGIL